MKLRIQVENKSYDVNVEMLDDMAPEYLNEDPEEFHIPSTVMQRRPPQRLPEDSVCRCPIARQITQIRASVGQHVRKDQGVLMIEAMKMETEIGPASDGVIKVIHVRTGDAVKPGQVLFELG